MTTAVARARSTDKRYYGVVSAIVTAVKDDKGKEGRVKLQFRWFDEKMETEWCRVLHFYAGNGYGAFFVPEEGDEVLVAFEHGDMRLPVILGGLYNGQDKPPSFRADDKNQKMIRTKGKHEILLDDTPGKQRVRIRTQGGHSADLSDEDKKIAVKSTGGHTVVLDDSGKKVTAKSTNGQTVVLDDSGNKITIQTSGGQSVTLDGAGKITLTAATIVLNGGAIKLGGEGAAMKLVLGDAFLTAFNLHTHNCTAPGSPSGPPVPPLTPAVLSQISKTS